MTVHVRDDFVRDYLERRRAWIAEWGPALGARRRANVFFHEQVARLVARQILPGSRVVDVGCADGRLLDQVAPSVAVGVDIDGRAIDEARSRLPGGEFVISAIEELDRPPLSAPEYIVLSLVLDEVYDVKSALDQVYSWSSPDTRLVLVTYNRLWIPLLRLAEAMGWKVPSGIDNYVPWREVENLLALAKFEVTKRVDGILVPLDLPIVGPWVNRWLAPLPGLRALSLVRLTIARPLTGERSTSPSVSVVVAARNEAGNIEPLIRRLPRLAEQQELIFVEGGSQDDTWEVLQRVAAEGRLADGTEIRCLKQPGVGKGDAVRAGFSEASGDILIILDADLSVPPEELPQFIEAVADDLCEFANGTRLVYPMDGDAMRALNLIGNRAFGVLLSFLLGQRITDSLCGTKAIRSAAYERVISDPEALADEDPFGDFTLLFGASRLGLRMRDVPVHYKERTYGATNISRFRHGVMLARMCAMAARRLKFVG